MYWFFITIGIIMVWKAPEKEAKLDKEEEEDEQEESNTPTINTGGFVRSQSNNTWVRPKDFNPSDHASV